MTVFVSIKELEAQLSELAARVEAGETVVVTRDGEPVFDPTPREARRTGSSVREAGAAGEREPASLDRRSGWINLEKGWAYLREKGITSRVPYIADDFDDPLPEDFPLRPLFPD